MCRLLLPVSLRGLSNGATELDGGTVGAAMDNLLAKAPALKPYLFDGDGIRPFVVILKNGKDIRGLLGLKTELGAQDDIRIVASVAGG